MLSEDRLKGVVGAMLDIDPASVGPDTSTDTVDQWDSVRHMNLIIALEDAFGITIPDEEVASLTSYPIIRLVVEEQLANAG
jgi:acyl carrier protein